MYTCFAGGSIVKIVPCIAQVLKGKLMLEGSFQR